MKIFAIGDLHLSGNPPSKPMDIFDKVWENHWEKIKKDWLEQVSAEDLVLLAGDTSWAMNVLEAREDLQRIINLPGEKIIIRGNHDYWWSTATKLKKSFGDYLNFVQNNYYCWGNTAICGSRGWDLPNEYYSEKDAQIFARELLRIENSLLQAQTAGLEKKILLLHYPPILLGQDFTPITELCSKYKVSQCIYGHLHGEDAFKLAFEGILDGTNYSLVSADYLGFELKKIVIA